MKTRLTTSGLFRQLPLDSCLSFCIITLMMSFCIPLINQLIDRTHLSGAITIFGSEGRVRVVDRIAVQGVLSDSSQINQPLPDIFASFSRIDKYPQFAYTDQGAGTSVTTQFFRTGQPIALSVNALGPQGEPGWSVMWQCGHYVPPAGWSSPAPVQAEGLTRTHLPSVCKNYAKP